jgi:hypothetical protein
MTKLSTRLPKESEYNGLEPNGRHLLAAYPSQEYVPVVGLIRTKEVLSDKDFMKIPKVEFVHIEGAFDGDAADKVRELLVELHDDRVRHVRQPLDLPDVEETPPVASAPLELTAAEEDVVDAEVEDDEPAVIGAGVAR